MVSFPQSRRVRISAAVALFAGFGLSGCGGGNETVEVKFPDVSKLSQPAPVGKASSGVQAGPESKGDPSETSRAK